VTKSEPVDDDTIPHDDPIPLDNDDTGVEYITDIQTNAPDSIELHGKYADASISYTVEDAEYNLIVKFIMHGTMYPIFLCYASQDDCNSWSTQSSLNAVEKDDTNGFLVVRADENAIAMLNVANNFYVLLTRIE